MSRPAVALACALVIVAGLLTVLTGCVITPTEGAYDWTEL